MLELIIIVLFCWLLFMAFRFALLLSVFAIPTLIGCLFLAGGVILLLPVVMLVVAVLLVNN